MSDQETRQTVQGLIAEILNRKKVPKKPEEIVEGISLTRDLGIDSLDILQLTATVEKKYGLKFPEADIKTMDDLSGILRAIEKYRPT